MARNAKNLLAKLAELRLCFSREYARDKIAVLKGLEDTVIQSAVLLEKYHEALCFLQAYPDNPEIERLADEQLEYFGERVIAYREKSGRIDALDESGITETSINYPYSFEMTKWLMHRFRTMVDIDWDDYDEKETDPLSSLLPRFALYVENDGIDDPDLATSDWIKMAAGTGNTLHWLIKSMERMPVDKMTRRQIYDDAELRLVWNLGRAHGSRTLAKTAARKIFYQTKPLKKRSINLHNSIRRAAPAIKIVSPRRAQAALETLILALLPRHRELWPATYANPSEAYISPLGPGLDVYLFGMLPDHRMPLETNYAALIMRNGVPIGYGIGVTFFKRCEIAINLFESFRSGEAGAIFEHFFRIFYHYFGARDFLVRRWQVGHENDEGIESGSYWFYYKLGFRSIDDRINDLARQEWNKILTTKGYRTDRPTLKKLARSDMYIAPGRRNRSPYVELQVTELAFAVTRAIADRHQGDRSKAFAHYAARLREAGISVSGLSKSERIQFERFCPLLGLIEDLDGWSRAEKRALLNIVKAKAGTREREYVLRLQGHARLEAALEKLATRP